MGPSSQIGYRLKGWQGRRHFSQGSPEPFWPLPSRTDSWKSQTALRTQGYLRLQRPLFHLLLRDFLHLPAARPVIGDDQRLPAQAQPLGRAPFDGATCETAELSALESAYHGHSVETYPTPSQVRARSTLVESIDTPAPADLQFRLLVSVVPARFQKERISPLRGAELSRGLWQGCSTCLLNLFVIVDNRSRSAQKAR